MTVKDTLFAEPINEVKDFVFDHRVADVFDDMIERSVPKYDEVQFATAALASELALAGMAIYDLGCATGTTIIELCSRLGEKNVRIVGVDNSGPMLERCRSRLQESGLLERVTLIESDLQTIRLEQASVVIMNYTLQFLPVANRLPLVQHIYQSLVEKGALLLTEKVRSGDSKLDTIFTELHYHYKRERGYSALEIAQKREALERVLTPLTIEENLTLLASAGFRKHEIFLKWYNFCSLIAMK